MKERLIGLGGLLAGIIILLGIPLLFDQFVIGRIFLTWPNGSIWSNMFASIWWVMIAVFCTWYLRDHIGRRLAAWWSKHHPQKDALKNLAREVAEAKAHALAARHIANDTYKAVNGGEDHPMAVGKTPAAEAVQGP
jgi:type VI protein secretion system component VasK